MGNYFVNSGKLTVTSGVSTFVSIEHDSTDAVIRSGLGNIVMVPVTGSITKIGVGTTAHSLNSNADLLVNGELEVKDTTYLGGNVFLPTNVSLAFTVGGGTFIKNATAQTNTALLVALPSSSNTLLIVEAADSEFDFAHAIQINPTIIIHSENQSTTEWGSFVHNQTDFIVGVGKGGHVTEHVGPVLLADDTSFDLPSASAGFGVLMVGDGEEYAQFVWSSDAIPTLISASSNVVTTDTDDMFCIFDNGTSVRIRNRLGSAKEVMFDYHFFTP